MAILVAAAATTVVSDDGGWFEQWLVCTQQFDKFILTVIKGTKLHIIINRHWLCV